MQAALEEKTLKEKLRLQIDSSKYVGSTHSPRTWEREEGEKIPSIFHGMRTKMGRTGLDTSHINKTVGWVRLWVKLIKF